MEAPSCSRLLAPSPPIGPPWRSRPVPSWKPQEHLFPLTKPALLRAQFRDVRVISSTVSSSHCPSFNRFMYIRNNGSRRTRGPQAGARPWYVRDQGCYGAHCGEANSTSKGRQTCFKMSDGEKRSEHKPAMRISNTTRRARYCLCRNPRMIQTTHLYALPSRLLCDSMCKMGKIC